MEETQNNSHSAETVTFLGTAGARFMVSLQLTASGGLWLELDDTQLLVDPGPGCIVQTTKRKLDPEKLSGIIVSHRHLDHAADVNVMVEAMTNGGFRRRGRLFAPADAFGPEPVIFSYLKNFIEGITMLEAETEYQIGNISFKTSIRHIHQVETYGMVFTFRGGTLGYIADTKYFEGLADSHAADVIIINMVLTEPRTIDHLAIPDAERIIREIKPKTAILSHFGMHVWQARPWLIAEELTQKTGIKVIAARDGMKFDLNGLTAIKQTRGTVIHGQPEI